MPPMMDHQADSGFHTGPRNTDTSRGGETDIGSSDMKKADYGLACKEGHRKMEQPAYIKASLLCAEGIDDYQLLDILGEGAFGKVYKAQRRSCLSDVFFAIKEIDKKKYRTLIDYEKEFAMHRLDRHPNIVNIYEFLPNPAKQLDYLVMEFCAGGNLNDYVIDKNPSVADKIGFMIDMAKGVHFLHQNNVIHRDLKPVNIMMAEYEGHGCPICKITDFGVSKIQKTMEDLFSTRVGTPYYTAPEVGFGNYTFTADVFSLGVVYMTICLRYFTEKEDITGKKEKTLLPIVRFGRYSLIECQINELNLRYPKLKSKLVCTNIKDSSRLGNLIDQMLAKEPSKRPGLGEEVVSALQQILQTFQKGAAQTFLHKLENEKDDKIPPDSFSTKEQEKNEPDTGNRKQDTTGTAMSVDKSLSKTQLKRVQNVFEESLGAGGLSYIPEEEGVENVKDSQIIQVTSERKKETQENFLSQTQIERIQNVFEETLRLHQPSYVFEERFVANKGGVTLKYGQRTKRDERNIKE